MKRPLLIAMMTASLIGGASGAMAQYTTSPDVAPPQNSTVVVTPGAGALYYRYNVSPFSGDQIRDYETARSACEARPLSEQPPCFDELNTRFTFEDATCAKFSGSALDACLHGADHGG